MADEGPIGPGVRQSDAGNDAPRPIVNCPYCLSSIAPDEAVETCPGCGARYHQECWQENGGCGVYGCTKAAVVESRRAIEIPLSHWGRETKACPSCGQEILAAALRCRHCGATFASARPQDVTEFQTHAAIEEQLPTARKHVIIQFVLSVIPFTAPIAAVWSWGWRRGHARELQLLPPLHVALSKIGLIASVAVSAALVIMTALYTIVRVL